MTDTPDKLGKPPPKLPDVTYVLTGEASKILGVPRSIVRRMIGAKMLDAWRPYPGSAWRIDRDSVIAMASRLERERERQRRRRKRRN